MARSLRGCALSQRESNGITHAYLPPRRPVRAGRTLPRTCGSRILRGQRTPAVELGAITRRMERRTPGSKGWNRGQGWNANLLARRVPCGSLWHWPLAPIAAAADTRRYEHMIGRAAQTRRLQPGSPGEYLGQPLASVAPRPPPFAPHPPGLGLTRHRRPMPLCSACARSLPVLDR